jgi:hypothetical protein
VCPFMVFILFYCVLHTCTHIHRGWGGRESERKRDREAKIEIQVSFLIDLHFIVLNKVSH